MSMDEKQLATLCPEAPEAVVHRHLRRLPEDYIACFGPQGVAEHLQAISRLSDQHPVEIMFEDRGPPGSGRAACTVIAFDHPFEFSLIAGTLSGGGLNIEAGDVYTLAAPKPPHQPRSLAARTGPPSMRPRRDGHTSAVIVDRFVGQRIARDRETPFGVWSTQLAEMLTQVITLLDRHEPGSVQQAKQRVNEAVTQRLATLPQKPAPMLLPVELDLQQMDRGLLRLTITAQDTPAYLYALATALSLRGLSIDRVRINQDPSNGRFTDVIDMTPLRRADPIDDRLLQRIRLSALLTKQFTYFLERAPDPYTALTRFERVVEDLLDTAEQDTDRWFELLANPHAMRDLAKLLGTSDYLWEDFIRGQVESLGPILQQQAEGRALTEPIETLPQRIEQALAGAVGLAEQQDRLNRFKDREIYQLDLDHILNPAVDFRRFSENLTFLAENLVATATRLVHEDLVRSYGEPPRGTRHAVFGLGKLGGVALGYASDIELLFVYEGDATAKTTGGKRKPITVSQFYEQLAQESSQFIRAKREGIFAVDLRLRPYGNQGPLAASIDAFQRYYSGEGHAHPFEMLALVRLRWIAGHAELGYHVERLRDLIVYEAPDTWLDLDTLWDVWCRMKREKLTERGRLNAKYSIGALVDLEGAVELLQVRHARSAPQVRIPRISQAMEGLHRAGVLSAEEYARMRGAYDFFRKLINGLRMLRGNARDLFLPAKDSMELTHLARRMDYPITAPGTNDAALRLLNDFELHTKHVEMFFEKHIGRPCPAPHHSIDTVTKT